MLLLYISSLLLALIYYIASRNLLHPGTLFNLWWGIIYYETIQNYYDFYPLSDETVTVLSIGMISFNLGCFLMDMIMHKNNVERTSIFDSENFFYKRTEKILAITLITLLALMIPQLIKVIPRYSTIGLSDLRMNAASGVFDDGSEYMSTFERLLYIHWVVYPMTKALFAISLVLWLTGKVSFRVFALALLDIGCVVILAVARTPAFFAAFCLICMLYEIRKDRSMAEQTTKKHFSLKKSMAYLFLLFAIAFMVKNGFERSNMSNTVLDTTLASLNSYFTGGVHLLDYALEEKNDYSLTFFTYGIITFRGILNILNELLYYASLKIIPWFLLDNAFSLDILSIHRPIGIGTILNAFPTAYYYFYRDFGLFGVFFNTLLFGSFTSYIYNRYQANHTLANICFLMESSFLIFFSVCWWYPHTSEYIMQLIYYFVFFYLFRYKNEKTKQIEDIPPEQTNYSCPSPAK